MSNWRIRLRALAKRIFATAIRLLPLNLVRALFEASMEVLHRRGPDFITHRALPKGGASGPYHLLDPILPIPSVPIGLIVQGPLLLKENFTVETVRYYSRAKPEVIVIVSVWEGEDPKAIEELRQLGAEIVFNTKPVRSGRSNVNFQVISTQGGLLRAKEVGCVFVAKTRSDQRVYSLPALLSLPQLLLDFPVRNTPTQRMRIISTSRLTSKYGPYHLSDLFMFGELNDLMEFWSPPIDDMEYHHLWKRKFEFKTLEELIKPNPENYLIREYLLRTTPKLTYSIHQWWKTLADRFCIIDWSLLDIYWPKYEPHLERSDLTTDHHLVCNPLRFLDWLSLYHSSVEELTPPEHLHQLFPQSELLPTRINCA